MKWLIFTMAFIFLQTPNNGFSQNGVHGAHDGCYSKPTDTPWNIHPIGCDCFVAPGIHCAENIEMFADDEFCKWSSQGIEGEGILYCQYKGEDEKGTVRQCDPEKLSSQSGPDGKYGLHCEDNQYCSDDGKCNACLEDVSCDDRNSKTVDKCIENEFYLQNKSCGHCETIPENSSANIKVSFIAGPGVSHEEIQNLITAASEIQPYKYLILEGKLSFNLASGSESGNMRLPYDTNKPINNQSDSFISEVKSYIDKVCTGTTYYVYVVDAALLSVTPGGNKTAGVFHTKKSFIFSEDHVGIMVHELGHAIGDLADEYPASEAYRNAVGIGINLEQIETGIYCPKFDDFGVDRMNCCEVTLRESTLRKSTSASVMGGVGNLFKFNIISCAGILEKAAGMDPKNSGVPFCENLAIQGEVLPQKQYPPGTYSQICP